jgi:hypothetical protein
MRATLGRGRAAAVVCAASALAAAAPARADVPVPEGGFAPVQLAHEPCETHLYPECRRLRFTYGPLVVTPGNNAQLVGPVTIEKPAEDGYVLRFKPDLVRADGHAPPVDEVHLHHATWLNTVQRGLTVPFVAAGEEKTVLEPRPGYGYLVNATDTWQINYMLHNATPRTETLWIVYDVDFVPKAAAESRGIRNVVPLWLDVLRDSDHPTYPVFNVQKGYGHFDGGFGRRVCSYPRETCAAFDPYGNPQPGNGRGWDYAVPPGLSGTLVGAAGHLHPGGLRDELSLVRGSGKQTRVRRIFNSDAHYWDPGGPISWDLSMTATRPDWKVRVRPGDRLRVNAVYDSTYASWYETMGILMAWIAPGDDSGVDPFDQVRVRERIPPPRRKARRRHRTTRRHAASSKRHRRRQARARYRWVWRPVPLDTQGAVTHGHLPEASHYGGDLVRPITARDGADTTQIGIGDFHYSSGDLSDIDSQGIPLVHYRSRLSFYNFDEAASIWHTITTCRAPCTGTVGISYPLANDLPPLDSLELGYGPTGTQPTSNRGEYTIEPAQVGLRPGSVVTYYCRVHPFMRGAFKVVP